ncbi:hypothetical protein TNCT_360931, partial [Trichonephila clavata]
YSRVHRYQMKLLDVHLSVVGYCMFAICWSEAMKSHFMKIHRWWLKN